MAIEWQLIATFRQQCTCGVVFSFCRAIAHVMHLFHSFVCLVLGHAGTMLKELYHCFDSWCFGWFSILFDKICLGFKWPII